MFTIINIFLAVIITALSYWWYSAYEKSRKLKWIPAIPGKPIIGNVLSFKNSTDTLNVLFKYTTELGGLCIMDIAKRKFVVATDYKFVEFILTSTTILNKSKEYRFIHRWLGSGLLTADGAKWKKTRKIITPAFHFSILEQFVDIFEANGQIMVNQLQKMVEEDSVDIYPYVTLCALDIICESAMGVSIHAQEDDHSEYVHAVKEMCRITLDRSFSPIKIFDTLYPLTKDYWKELKYVRTLHRYTNSVINSRREELKNMKTSNANPEENIGTKKKMAFLDLLLQATIDGEPLSDTDIREEVDTFMFEGHDTTASAISFTLYCLANHPEIQALAFEEQVKIFGENMFKSATYRDLQNMKYLEFVIKEALRLYPSVPFFGRETHEDIVYNEQDGLIIPKGVAILIFGFGVNRNPDYYKDPDKFIPERFQHVTGTSPYSFISFSAGPRNCIGQKFAMLEMKSTISKLLRYFELCPAVPEHKLILAAEAVLKSVNGIKIKLRQRLPIL